MSSPRQAGTWEDVRASVLDATVESTARREVGCWVVDALERALGPDWLSNSAGERGTNVVSHMATSNPSLFRSLLLALRLEDVADTPGRRPLLRCLRSDFGPGRFEHVETQLEVATLAQSQRWAVRFEEPLRSPTAPVDVVLRASGTSVPVEVKVLLTSGHDKQAVAAARGFDPIYIRLLADFDVRVTGTFPGIPNDLGLRLIASELESIARSVQSDRVSRRVSWHGAELTLSWAGAADGDRTLTMPVPLGDDRARVRKAATVKAEQAAQSGARWLRLDLLGGYFWRAPGSHLALADRLPMIIDDLRDALGETTWDGVVVSSGKIVTPGIDPEFVRHDSGAVALARPVTPVHSRITVVMPLRPAAAQLTEEWIAMYDTEPVWLEQALARRSLPSLAEIMSREER